MNTIITPGATIGVLGNGQLGLMLAQAAQRLDYNVIFYSDVPGCADRVGKESIIAPYDNEAKLVEFAGKCDVVTLEFENIPEAVNDVFKKTNTPFYPGRTALFVSQNRLREKQFAQDLDIPVPDFKPITQNSFGSHREIMYPVILKTAEGGYDGKGQTRAADQDELDEAWEKFGFCDCIAEAIIDFRFEFSVIVARKANGEMLLFDPFENTHANGILSTTTWPLRNKDDVRIAGTYAKRLADKLDLVGLLAVEFFCSKQGEVIFNEMAPRPHNSGHLTIDCAWTSQFEQHIRAICNLQFGNPGIKHAGKMTNVIGDDKELHKALTERNAHPFFYGKEPRPGRKLGHIVRPV